MKKYFFFVLSVMNILGYAQGVEPVVLISGKVVNERNMEPIAAKVIYEELPDGKLAGIARSNPLTGEYKIILPRGKNYGYYAIAEGYYSIPRHLDVRKLKKYEEIDEQNLFMAPVKKDQVIFLNNVFFKGRTAELLPESYPELKRFIEFLKENKRVKILITGHTDNRGKAEELLELSTQRAQKIADYLIANGIKEKRIQVKGYGGSRPIAFNKSKEGRERNNRIEVIIVSTGKKD